MKKNQEIAVIEVLQPELLTVVQSSQIEVTKAESHALAFMPFMQDYALLATELKSIEKINPTIEDAAKAREIRLKGVKIRTGSEKTKDARSESLNAEKGLILNLNGVVKNTLILMETEALEIEKHQERIEAVRKQELAETRIKLLEPFEVETMFLPLAEMTEDQFQIILAKGKESFEAVTELRKQAEVRRLEEEKQAEENRIIELNNKLAEEKRIAEENIKLRAEKEKAEKELAFQRLKVEEENKKRDLELKKEREKAESDRLKLQAENDRIAKIAEDNAKEHARINAELQKKQAAIDLANEQEKRRIEDEENERIAKEKAEATAPDVDKMRSVYAYIKSYEFPEMKTAKGIEAMEVVKSNFVDLLKLIEVEAKGLKL